MKKILFVNSCVNRDKSRTMRLSKSLLDLLQEKESDVQIEELILENENIQALNSITLEKRLSLVKEEKFEDDMFKYAHQLMDADCIVIAAPYWDLGFPAMLKNYIESTSVAGLTYKYSETGRPIGQCKGQMIYYVTTCGGFIRNLNLGYDTIKALAGLFGINDSKCISAEGLDIITNDVEEILKKAIMEMPNNL